MSDYTPLIFKGGDLAKAEEITSCFETLLAALSTLCPASREFAICKTKLEEACFFAHKSVVLHADGPKVSR